MSSISSICFRTTRTVAVGVATFNYFFLLLPRYVSAAAPDADFGEFGNFARAINEFINDVLIPLIFAIALLVFIWGMFTYFILGGGDEGQREKGKGLIVWAIVGFVMMIIILAVVNLVANGLLSGMGQDGTGLDVLPGQAEPE